MNAVWNSYGQLCGCPEIFKKSCKFFCRGLDIRVSEVVYSALLNTSSCICQNLYLVYETRLRKREDSFVQLANSKDYRHFKNNAGNR